jgi:hypothetical protein
MVQIYWEYLSDLFQGLNHFRKLIICNQNRRYVSVVWLINQSIYLWVHYWFTNKRQCTISSCYLLLFLLPCLQKNS